MEFELEESLVEETWEQPIAPPVGFRALPPLVRSSQWGVWIPEECANEDCADLRSGLVAVA